MVIPGWPVGRCLGESRRTSAEAGEDLVGGERDLFGESDGFFTVWIDGELDVAAGVEELVLEADEAGAIFGELENGERFHSEAQVKRLVEAGLGGGESELGFCAVRPAPCGSQKMENQEQ